VEGPPRNVVVVLLDSLNRHLLGCYGGTEFETPSIDAFARRAVRFTNHVAGSLPCMPARHDLLCGALDFLWKPWGSVEIWEDAITYHLRRAGVTTMLVSDHPHLFETGGENYHTDFHAWDYVRGHEDDPWRTRPDPSATGAPESRMRAAAPAPFARGYDTSRTYFRTETDYPGPRTMTAATEWLRANAGPAGAHERFFLLVDEFDPHEPFDTPEPWASRYDADWDGPILIWPPYARSADRAGLSPREARQLRANYGAKLSMIDHWFGRLVAELDRLDRWADTAVILCTDHGHFLGERGIWGKPAVPMFEPMVHVPLLVAWPGVAPGRCHALTTTVDLHATIADAFGVTDRVEHRTHGCSLVPLLDGSATSVREWALAGVWGREVHVVGDQGRGRGPLKYCRAPAAANEPLSMWSNRWSTMPVHAFPEIRLPRPDGRARLARMPGSAVPVIRQPFDASDALPFWASSRFDGTHLYDIDDDPGEERNLAGTAAERAAADLLRAALDDVDAPADQYARLGL
jgi:arylsulfatase A-like enzyme